MARGARKITKYTKISKKINEKVLGVQQEKSKGGKYGETTEKRFICVLRTPAFFPRGILFL